MHICRLVSDNVFKQSVKTHLNTYMINTLFIFNQVFVKKYVMRNLLKYIINVNVIFGYETIEVK